MNWATDLVKAISGLELSPNYAYLYLLFLVITISFFVWVYYFAVYKNGVRELSNITWLSFRDTVKYTLVTIFTIFVFGMILFGYDFILDKLVNTIIQYAN